MKKIISLIILGLSAYSAYLIYNILKDNESPNLPDFYWGPKENKNEKEDKSIRPFQIKIEDKIIADLKLRLKIELEGNRFVPPLENIAFEYGFNTNYLKKLSDYWLNKYDWKAREKLLNKYPSFKTKIAGIDIHFQHAKSSNNNKYKATKPLILLHGFPGSIIEFQKVIPLLLDPKDSDINFELIIPSLPGYGFSERAHRTGMGVAEIAQILNKLMKRLNFDKYLVHGGDWGALILADMTVMYPESIEAAHSTLCYTQHTRSTLRMFLAFLFPNTFWTDMERKHNTFSKFMSFTLREMGYFNIQATKPDTVGVGLSNSPTGLLAYIAEKFSTWTNREWISKEDGGLSSFNPDDLLDNVMVYWITNSITTSARLYSEFYNLRGVTHPIHQATTKVPTGCMKTPEEILYFPNDGILEKFHNAKISFTEKGGHFTAFEVPEIFVKNVLIFFNNVNK